VLESGDLFVFGDIRDVVREGKHLATGEDTDHLVLGLAAAGLAVTAATYVSLGGAAPLRDSYPCKDGWVFFLAATVGTSIDAVADLVTEKGMGDEFDPAWRDLEAPVVRRKLAPDEA